MMLAAALVSAAALGQPTPRDVWRAKELVPRQEFSGVSANHASSNLNAHLLRQQTSGLGLPVRTCESFHQGELDAVLMVLAGGSEADLGDIYEKVGDNRRLAPVDSLVARLSQERQALLSIRESNHSLGAHVGDLSRDRKCIEAVMRYAHHISSRKRLSLRNSTVRALPLLPAKMGRDVASAAHHPAAAPIVEDYRKAVSAIDCHIDVFDGCPGGDFTSCTAACPGVPDAGSEIEEECRITCSAACGLPASASAASNASAHGAQQKGQKLEPPYWGDQFQVVMSRNETREDGSDAGFRACMRWYDWTQFASRTDCTRDGVTSTTLTVRGTLYVTFPGPPFCVASDLGITPVSPAWLQEGSIYIGQQVINGILCEVWDKAEGPGGDSHFYAVRADDNRTPVQMLTTGPDLGEGRSSNQKDYIMYLEREIDPQLFEVPPQCEDARRLTWAEISAVPELTLD